MARINANVKQYNSLISWQTEGTEPTQDTDGNIIPGTPGETVTSRCRYENYQGTRKEFIGRDGKTVFATGRVYIKFGDVKPPRFIVGAITTDGIEIYKGEVMNTFEGQMNKTIYTVEDVRI